MNPKKASSHIKLTEHERDIALVTLGTMKSLPASVVLDSLVAAINSVRPRCRAESGLGQCLYAPHNSGSHFNGAVSWYE